MAARILIVDDELDLLDILGYNLEKNGYSVETVSSGEAALLALEKNEHYDLVLLDVMMRGMDGFRTAEQMRRKGYQLPIIFLTALDTEADLLKGFSLGADDYISKPFSVKEVIARVKAVLARVEKSTDKMTFAHITLDPTSKKVLVGNELVKLTKTEYLLLLTLMQNQGRVFSRQELLDKVWREDAFIEARTIDVHIARLRKKLLSAGSLIINRSGYGYCIEE
ncbi:MAG: response regulator transcription factor [Lentimicrobiaceae bacterium]|jgi:DNA-binding response OmpR family regulator|nr:response regulator transcription factor [Lentimicrobiaceae bacterium]